MHFQEGSVYLVALIVVVFCYFVVWGNVVLLVYSILCGLLGGGGENLPAEPPRAFALSFVTAFSQASALSCDSSSSCCALRNLARLRAAISSAPSICLLYVLIFCWSLSTRSCMRSWFLRSSSAWKVSSFILLSDLRRFFWASACLLCSPSSSPSSSRTLVSSLAMVFLPPLSAAASASSTRT